MRNLDPSGTPSSLPMVFSLLGDPMNPNDGLLARFPGREIVKTCGSTVFGVAGSWQ